MRKGGWWVCMRKGGWWVYRRESAHEGGWVCIREGGRWVSEGISWKGVGTGETLNVPKKPFSTISFNTPMSEPPNLHNKS